MAIEDLRKQIKDDPETAALELSDDEVFEVARYLMLRDSDTMPGYQPKLILKPSIQIIYIPTKQRQTELATQKLKEYLETFESDVFIQEASFENFKPVDEYQTQAYQYIQSFLENFPKHYMRGVYLYGPYGTGKSYLLSALANLLSEQNYTVVFTFLPDFARNIKGSIKSNDLEKKINVLKRCDVLILDDLGGEHTSAWIRDEILLPILQYRLNASLPVFVSSNLRHKELAETLEFDGDRVKVIRFMERIRELTKPFEFVQNYHKNKSD